MTTEPRGSHALHALKRKRAQIAGFIADHERKARDWRVALAHVDATLKLFDDELDPDTIKLKRPHRKSQHYSGPDLARLCLDELRKADGMPLTTVALADIAMAAGNVPDQHHVRFALRQRITKYLTDKEKAGEMVRVGVAHSTAWKLPPERLDSAQDEESLS